ncbi:MAG: non-hydrolyzing UDP-N-acetylglucosamine 2-epimerase [Candidatus Zixiibacteriota bacterium]
MNVEDYERQLSRRASDVRGRAGGATAHTNDVKDVILVAGARPNFVKLAPLYAELKKRPTRFRPLILHTGQHYDSKMSDVFFTELELPQPDISLGVGSGSHSHQTARIMVETERVFTELGPHLVVVFGDVNSTLAASITAAKLEIPVAHVEAGLRSFDRSMPEEINRMVTDVLADLLLTPSRDANRNLEREGIPREKIEMVGNIMIDTLVRRLPETENSNILERLGIEAGAYALMTMHRPGNVDDGETVEVLLDIIEGLAKDHKVVFPVHPRTRKSFIDKGWRAAGYIRGALDNLILTEPLGYIDFLKLQKESAVTLTDSGGVQEETTYLGAPCLTLRPNTERPVTITHGSNHLIGLNAASALEHARRFLKGRVACVESPPLWDGKASIRIVDALERFLFEGNYRREMDALHSAAREEALWALRRP